MTHDEQLTPAPLPETETFNESEKSQFTMGADFILDNVGHFNARQLEMQVGDEFLRPLGDSAELGQFDPNAEVQGPDAARDVYSALRQALVGRAMGEEGWSDLIPAGARSDVQRILDEPRLQQPFVNALRKFYEDAVKRSAQAAGGHEVSALETPQVISDSADSAEAAARRIVEQNPSAHEHEPMTEQERLEVVDDLGETALEQVVDESVVSEAPSPWSAEAAKDTYAYPTETQPHLFDPEDRVQLTTVQIGDRTVLAVTRGWYRDGNQKIQMLLGPVNPEDVPLFEGRRITKSRAEMNEGNKVDKPTPLIDRVPSFNTPPEPPEPEDAVNGNAMTMDEFRALMAEQSRQTKASEVNPGAAAQDTASPETPAEVEPVETELAMYQRFVREAQAELAELYARLRSVAPNSYEANAITNRITQAKEDAGKYARTVARLQGNTNWH